MKTFWDIILKKEISLVKWLNSYTFFYSIYDEFEFKPSNFL